MEYEIITNLLKENLEIKELIERKLPFLAIDILNEQYLRLYNLINLNEFTLKEIENLDVKNQ